MASEKQSKIESEMIQTELKNDQDENENENESDEDMAKERDQIVFVNGKPTLVKPTAKSVS